MRGEDLHIFLPLNINAHGGIERRSVYVQIDWFTVGVVTEVSTSIVFVWCPAVRKLRRRRVGRWFEDQFFLAKAEPLHRGTSESEKNSRRRAYPVMEWWYIYSRIHICICVVHVSTYAGTYAYTRYARVKSILSFVCVYTRFARICDLYLFRASTFLSSVTTVKGRRAQSGAAFYQPPRLPLLVLQSICCRARSA